MITSFAILGLGAVVFLSFAALGALADWIDGINK
jgi:hypothetical protein